MFLYFEKNLITEASGETISCEAGNFYSKFNKLLSVRKYILTERMSSELQFPQMMPIKFSLMFDPPKIGLLYKRHPSDKKNQLFVIELNG
jgi:hypothetical protein